VAAFGMTSEFPEMALDDGCLTGRQPPILTAVRSAWRRRAPKSLQLGIALCRRELRDHWTGMARDIVEPVRAAHPDRFPSQAFSLVQPIRKSLHWEGKVANLRIAAERLNGVTLPPNRVLSFWRAVGAPTEDNGFRLGRSIRSDSVGADIGGGLCQISGLLYETGLRAGLQIVERQAHTQDLYTDETRFTALGLDATVVWGHKDVRLRNTTAQSLVFNFEVTTEEIRATLWSERPMDLARLVLETEDCGGTGRRVSVFRQIGPQRSLISSDFYKVADLISSGPREVVS
jgi:vancomycin resistance protein VanW